MIKAETDLECGHTKAILQGRDVYKILMFFKSDKIITFSHLNSNIFKENFKDNIVREKVNKMASKAKTLNIFVLSLTDDVILSRKK